MIYPWFPKIFFSILFADGSCLITIQDDFKELIQHANNGLSLTSKWFKTNKLTLNVEKSNFIIFYDKNKKYPKDDPNISSISKILRSYSK